MKTFCIDACINLKIHGEFWRKTKALLPGRDKSKSKVVYLEMIVLKYKFFCDMAKSDGGCFDINDFADHPSVKLIAHNSILSKSQMITSKLF